MNKRFLPPAFLSLPRVGVAAFLLCAVSFLVGVLCGTFAASGFAAGEAAAGFLSGYFSVLREDGVSISFLTVFLQVSWVHLAAFLFGFTALGVVLIPALAAVRGFTAAFALAVLVRLYAAGGAAAGVLLLGVPALFSLPLFFPLAADSFCVSLELLRTGLFGYPPSGCGFSRATLIRFLAAVLLLLLISLTQRALLLSGLFDLLAIS